LIPKLAQVGAAEVAGNEAVNNHLPCPLARCLDRLNELNIHRFTVTGQPQVKTCVTGLGCPGTDENRNRYLLALELVPDVVNPGFHVLFRELDRDGFHLGNAVLVELFNLNKHLVVGERVSTHGAGVGVETMAKADQYERHRVTSQGFN